MSNTKIPESVKRDLWFAAHGRCEFAGCNKVLFKHGITMDECNISNYAHIIGDSPKGPRGDEKQSKELAKDINNLILLCPECHKLIDSDEEKYTVEVLRNMKREHEKRITKNEKGEDVVSNPVNPEENFADKWPYHPKRRENFYKWLFAVKKDVHEILDGANKIQIQDTMGRIFGKDIITKASSLLVERRKSKLAAGTALLTNAGKVAANTVGKIVNTANTFYGE